MKRNGHKPTDPAGLLSNLIIPGVAFNDSDYTRLKLRLDCYEDYILARKYSDTGKAGALFALDPLDVATALAGLTLTTPLLPPGYLFWQRAGPSASSGGTGGERLAIYAGPQTWAVHVADGGKKREALRVPMPGLVWIGQGTEYSLYAVKGSEWPTGEAELFHPPTPNVGVGICRGNVNFPVAGVETIWPALRLFFESDFNDHLSNGKSKAYPKSVLAGWRALAGAESWPEGDLVGAGKVLREVMG